MTQIERINMTIEDIELVVANLSLRIRRLKAEVRAPPIIAPVDPSHWEAPPHLGHLEMLAKAERSEF